jgi:hypothetical protein
LKSQVDVMTMCNERVNQVETEGGKLIVTDDDEGEPDESTNREQPRKRRRETNPTRGASDKTTETEASPNEPARESQPMQSNATNRKRGSQKRHASTEGTYQ